MKSEIIFPEAVFLMDKLVYALNLIVDFVDTSDIINENRISDFLSCTGFEEHEIRRILALLGIGNQTQTSGFRIFSKKEKQLFTPEALNFLNKLLLAGVIDFISAEEIIEHAYDDAQYKISIEQLKEITLMLLIEKRGDAYLKSGFSEDIYN